jgi:hypothetical protein
MNDNDVIDKIKEIYSDFTLKIESLINKEKDILKTYRQKLEEAKIKELKDSIFK